MGGFLSNLWKGIDPQTPIKGIGPRIKNIVIKHHRGLFGVLGHIIFIPLTLQKNNHANTVKAVWMWMAWFFLFQPVNIPVSGMIPIFALPMAGAMSSDKTCVCYMNEGSAMFILANIVLLLWNNCGLDRRIMLWFLSAGDVSQCSSKRLVLKCCMASFILSMFSNRLIVSNIMIQYITPIMTNLQSSTSRATEPNFDEMRYILNNAIQTSCSIGGIAIIHSSYGGLAFRTLFQHYTVSNDHAWHDIFNYLEYSAFAVPLAILMLIFNCIYHILLIRIKTGKPMTPASMTKVRFALREEKKNIPKKVTLHEKIALFFSILVLITYFTRWSKYFTGWAGKFDVTNDVPGVRDATVAATYAILLHSLPSGIRFIKVWTAKKRSQFGRAKPESGVLWWRFVDKNLTYGYLFLIGSGVALSTAIRETKYNEAFADSAIAKIFSNQSMAIYLLLVTAVSTILANVMSSVASVVIFIPFVMNLFTKKSARRSDVDEKLDKIYLGSLAAGIGASLGFVSPFLYTPAYFCHYTGKVPKKKMAMYGAGSAIICLLVLWVFVSFYAPMLWNATTIKQVLYKAAATTVVGAPTQTAPAPDPGAAPPDPAPAVDLV